MNMFEKIFCGLETSIAAMGGILGASILIFVSDVESQKRYGVYAFGALATLYTIELISRELRERERLRKLAESRSELTLFANKKNETTTEVQSTDLKKSF